MSYLFKTSTKQKDDQSNPYLDSVMKNPLMNSSNMSLRNDNFALREKIKELEYEIKTKKEIIDKLFKELKDNKEERRISEKEFNSQLIYYKRLHDTMMAKENIASQTIKLTEAQHNVIIQLENKIEEIKQSYEEKIKQMELEHENKYSKLKKQMMVFLKNTKKIMAKNNEENLELNSKLTMLYKNQMLNELENQSLQIEKLLKEKEKQSKEIYFLKEELKIHKKVEGIIKNKNSKYLNMINKINIKINQIQDTDVDSSQKKNKKHNTNYGRAHSVKIINNTKTKIISNNALSSRQTNQTNLKEPVDNIDTKINDNAKNCKSLQDVKGVKDNNKINPSLNKKKKIIFDVFAINREQIYNKLFKEIIILLNKAWDNISLNQNITTISKSNLFTKISRPLS